MRTIYTQKLTRFFVTLFAMFSFLVTCEYANAVTVTLTARVKEANNSNSNDTYSNDLVVVAVNKKAEFKLFGEYNGKPPLSEEIKPGDPEWKFDSAKCDSHTNVPVQVPKPDSWTKGATISGTANFTPNAVGEYRLTYKASVRFPKLKRSDGSHIKDAQGNFTYFPVDSATVTVSLKATNAKFKVWIESTDDNFPGHSQFKLGLLESGKVLAEKIDTTTNLTFTVTELEVDGNVAQLPFTVNGESKTITAGKKAGTGTVKVKVKDSNGKDDYEKENLEITVVEPSGMNMVRSKLSYQAGKIHTKDSAGIGFCGVFYLTPSDVSFGKLSAWEGVGNEAATDGQVSDSGWFKTFYDDCYANLERLEQVEQMRREVGNNSPDMIARLDAAESMIQVDLSKLKNDFPYINFEKTKFFWHGGIKAVSPIFSNIQGGTNKPNTLILVDNIEFGHYEKGEFELPNPPGFIDGVVSWNIAYSYKLDENTQKQDFSRMIETFIITPVGTMSSIKGNGSATATYEEKSSSIRDADLTNTP